MLLTAIGLDFLSESSLLAFAVAATVGATIGGWLTDAVMGARGYGVVGNTCLILVGAVAGLAATTRIMGPLEAYHASTVVTIASFCSIAILMLFSVAKQALR